MIFFFFRHKKSYLNASRCSAEIGSDLCCLVYPEVLSVVARKKWHKAKYICLKGLTHQFTGSKRHEAHYWQKPILLLIRKYGTLLPSQTICSWHLGGIKNPIYWICGGSFTSVHQCCVWCISTTNGLHVFLLQLARLDKLGIFYLISLLTNNSTFAIIGLLEPLMLLALWR